MLKQPELLRPSGGLWALSGLPAVVGIDLFGDIFVADILGIDHLELRDGLLALGHFLEHATQQVNQFLLLVVENRLLLDGILEGARGQIVDAAPGEALAEIAQRLDAPVRVALGLLELLHGLSDLAHLKIELPQLKSDLEVGPKPLDAL